MRPVFSRCSSFSLGAAAAAALAVASLIGGAPARADPGIKVYTNLAAWQSVTSQTALFDFEGIAGPGQYPQDPSLTPLTVNVSGGGTSHYFVVDSTTSAGGYSLNGTDVLAAGYYTGSGSYPSAEIVFGDTVSAFAMEYGFRYPGASRTGQYTIELRNGTNTVATYNSPSLQTDFIGIVSPEAVFDRIRITSSGLNGAAYSSFDNLRLGRSELPEPGSLPLMVAGTALPLMGGFARRYRQRRRTLV